MSVQCTNIQESTSNSWVRIMGLVFGIPSIESTRYTKISLCTTLDEIQRNEQDLHDDLARHVSKIKGLRKSGQPVDRVDAMRMKPVLMQCRKIRLKLQTLEKKKHALESHMETLSNSELNQHVLQSMQKTSHALKGMGLDKTLESVDRVMLDLEENHSDIASIQNSLSMPFDSADDCDWEAELAMLLGESTFVSPPATLNRIAEHPPERPKTPTATTEHTQPAENEAEACIEEQKQPTRLSTVREAEQAEELQQVANS
jgi:hypothetical protein